MHGNRHPFEADAAALDLWAKARMLETVAENRRRAAR